MSEKFKVEIQSYEQLSPIEQKMASNNGSGKEYACYVRVTHNGQTVYLESDACEPEDKTFYRDFGWVVDALKKAYELGVSDA